VPFVISDDELERGVAILERAIVCSGGSGG
jgi:hypothetical protein